MSLLQQFNLAQVDADADKKIKAVGGKATLYKRSSTQHWQVRFKLANNKWHSQSTCTPNKDEAIVKKYKSVVDRETGLRKQVEVPKRIREWWFKNEQGKMCVSIRYGTQTIELAKGKGSIEVDSASALIRALELVKQAVESGELDTQINNASVNVRKVFEK
jgi:hypothetical protein